MLNYFCFCRVKATIWILAGVVIYLVKTTIWSDGCLKFRSVAHMVNLCYSDDCCYWPECLRNEQRERLSEFFVSEMKIYLRFIWMKIYLSVIYILSCVNVNVQKSPRVIQCHACMVSLLSELKAHVCTWCLYGFSLIREEYISAP
jgi:hypothetical protein